MKEKRIPQPEAKYPPQDLITEIKYLYLTGKHSVFLGEEGEKQRNRNWRAAVEEFPVYADQIDGFKKVTEDVKQKKKENPSIRNITNYFILKNEEAGMFLDDILLSRVTPAKSPLDTQVALSKQALAMTEEMGYKDVWRNNKFKRVSIEEAISSILQGNLKLKSTPQPKQGPK